jgi:hypothetical protein
MRKGRYEQEYLRERENKKGERKRDDHLYHLPAKALSSSQGSFSSFSPSLFGALRRVGSVLRERTNQVMPFICAKRGHVSFLRQVENNEGTHEGRHSDAKTDQRVRLDWEVFVSPLLHRDSGRGRKWREEQRQRSELPSTMSPRPPLRRTATHLERQLLWRVALRDDGRGHTTTSDGSDGLAAEKGGEGGAEHECGGDGSAGVEGLARRWRELEGGGRTGWWGERRRRRSTARGEKWVNSSSFMLTRESVCTYVEIVSTGAAMGVGGRRELVRGGAFDRPWKKCEGHGGREKVDDASASSSSPCSQRRRV